MWMQILVVRPHTPFAWLGGFWGRYKCTGVGSSADPGSH